jgi:hypothetical protein
MPKKSSALSYSWADLAGWNRNPALRTPIRAPDMPELFDVLAVNIETGKARVLAAGKTEAKADAIVSMAVLRRGVEDEFFKAVPHGNNAGHEPAL